MGAIPASLSGNFLSDHVAKEAKQIHSRFATSSVNNSSSDTEIENEVAKLSGMFIYQMLQAMRRTVPKSDLIKQGFSHDVYYAMFDQEVANNVAKKGDFGLTDLLVKQFKGDHKNILTPARRLDGLSFYQKNQQVPNFAFNDPIRGRLSSPYGWRVDPINQAKRFHQGIDIAAPKGTDIESALDGKVSFSGEQGGYGQLVIIDHADGYQTYYAHNEVNLVAIGDTVDRGQPIAQIGDTGRATGVHLHFEIRKNGELLDPITLLPHLSRDVKSNSRSDDR